MTNDDIKKAAISAIHDHYNCNGEYPCSERSYCQFCSGYNSAFDCNECGADDFNEGFLDGARWRINSVWHTTADKPDFMRQCFLYLRDPMREGWHIGRVEKQGTNKGKWNIYGYFTPALHKYVARWAYIADLLPDRKEEEK